MPCIKCSNGKWKYGEKGKCLYNTLKKCKEAAAAIHTQEKTIKIDNSKDIKDKNDTKY